MKYSLSTAEIRRCYSQLLRLLDYMGVGKNIHASEKCIDAAVPYPPHKHEEITVLSKQQHEVVSSMK